MLSILNVFHWNIDPIIFQIGSFGLRYYALCFLAAFVVSYVLMLRVFNREGKSQELLDQLSIYIFLGTLIGARLGHCLFYEFDYYMAHPLEMILPFRISNNNFEFTGFQGLASHGGAIGIITALWLFSRKTKTNFVWIADRLVLVVPLAGAFVRLGNFFNSEIIGLPTSLPWGVVFEKHDEIARHPAQIYEAICYVIIFLILWAMYQKNSKPKPGLLFGIFLVLLFGVRFGLEFFKENQEAFEEGMKFNMGQLLSLPFVAIGFYLIFKKPKAAPAKK
ncbi:prolipoprotein diacylglyceryl transferase [Sphingobacterium sp. JB170]|uniref:prolipoprotein diacylglyceryl transferase n=1 Tax=Sphingobacterium sp. JB170 TaxID=1434842 RepID=UPI00097F290D|nr:prolipoprotein diacylglyceryl transferase [Sphingobacterium sp. JB170]SJN39504.1 Prolipoprotein diacylglyceryl transferase [Sphingobacterium sp. JB170]